MPQQFKTFDYGNVLAQAEGIKGARTRNVLAQQQGERAQTTFDQKQQQANTQDLYQGLVEISQNPAAAQHHVERWKRNGIMREDFDYSQMSDQEISQKAAEGAQAIGQSLQMQLNKGRPKDVQSTEWLMKQTPEVQQMHLRNKRANRLYDVGGGFQNIDPMTQQPAGEVIPKTLAPKDQPANIQKAEEVKADVARKADITKKRPKAIGAYQALVRQTKTVNSHIDKALNLIGPFSTGAAGWFSFMPNSEAGKLNNELNTIKANIGFDKLQNMRDNSPTGGALGQVSEFENRLLQAVNGALDPMQRDQLQENLVSIKELYSQVMEEKRQHMKTDYDYGEDAPAQEMSIDDLVSKYAQ